jgi:PAS domain S-box-containing protein
VILTLEDDLQTHREELAPIVLDEIYQFVGLLDTAGMTLEINRAALEGAGIRLDEIQGKPFWEARWWQVSMETQEYQRELVQRASRGEFVRSDIEIYGKAAGKETIIIDFSLLPVRDQTGKIIFLLPEGHNITEKRLAEAETARKNVDLQQLLDQAHEKLRQSERRFRLLLENVQGYAIFMLDLEGSVTTWNAGAENIKGYKANEILGRHFSCFYLPEDVESGIPDAALREAAATGRFANAGWRVRKDGSRFWADINITALREPNGELVGFSKITRDLTERRQSEMKAQELKEKLAFELSAMTRLHDLSTRLLVKPELPQLLAEVLDATIALHGADFGNAQLFNPETGALEIVAQRGFEKEFLDHFKEVHDEKAACGRARALRQRVVIEDVQTDPDFEPHRTVAGAAGFRAVQSTPLIGRGGDLLGMLSTHFREPHRPSEHTLRLTDLYTRYAADMIDRKRAEESQSKLASLVENSLDFIGIATLDRHAVFVNRAGQRLVGLDRDQDAHSKKIEEYIIPEDQPRLLEVVLPIVLREGRWEGEMRFRHFKTGAAIPMHHHVFFIKEPDTGRNLALATIGRDMRERKQAEEAMLAAQAQLAHISRVVTMGELTASVAHEINQPLSAIVNNANACRRMLKSGSIDLEEVEHTVTDIADLGRRAGEVISNIRAFLRKSLPGKSRLEINPVIHEAIAFMSAELSKHGVSIHTDLSPKLPQVLGDRVQLQQVLLNLMINAVEAMSSIAGRSRELWIRSQSDTGGTISIAIQDSGTGFDPTETNNLFNAFVTTKSAGLGMGLAISRSIIEAHDGHLWARPNQNYGATFEFTLPT